MKTAKIPKFKSIAQEAEFWDTHDVTDYMGSMKFADVEFAPKQKKAKTITFRIEPKLKEDIDKIARHLGLNVSTLYRTWLIENVRKFAT